jgi:uncharacterized integral membrane protein
MTDPHSAGDGGPGPEPVRDRRRDLRLVVTGVVAVLLVWFALANLQDVKIHFWVYSTHASLITVIAIAVVLGAAAAVLLSRHRRHPDSGGG